MTVVVVRRITILNYARIARIIDPSTGRRHSHGLGVVGTPLRPYLGPRHEGYALALPDDLNEIDVRRVDFSGVPNRKGFFPTVRVDLADLGADDLIAEERA